MASFFNLFRCFSEPASRSKKYVCNGDVCTLSDRRYLAKKDDKLSLLFSLGCLSTRKA